MPHSALKRNSAQQGVRLEEERRREEARRGRKRRGEEGEEEKRREEKRREEKRRDEFRLDKLYVGRKAMTVLEFTPRRGEREREERENH